MSQITRCPSCATSFKVVADQLRISEGWVRCGQCKEVFDASAHLLPVAPAALLPDVSLTDTRPPPAPTARKSDAARAWGGGSAPPSTPAWEATAQAAPAAVDTAYPAARADGGDRHTGTSHPMAAAPVAPVMPVLDIPAPAVPAFLAVGAAASEENRLNLTPEAPFSWGPAPARRPPEATDHSPSRPGQEVGAPVMDEVAEKPMPDVAVGFPGEDVPLPASVLGGDVEAAGGLRGGYELPAADPDDSISLPDLVTPGAEADGSSVEEPSKARVDLARRSLLSPEPVHAASGDAPSELHGAAPDAPSVAPAQLPSVDFVQLPAEDEALVALALVADDSPASVLQARVRTPASGRADEEARDEGGGGDAGPEVSFVVDARRKAFWRKPAVRVALLLVLLVLIVGLLLQVAVQERDRIAAVDARAKPWLLQLCEPLQCEIAPQRQIADVVIDSSSFTKARGDSYQLALAMKSKADIPLAMPAVELTLTDAQDQPVLRRVLLPADMAAPAELPARGEWSTSVSVIVTTGGARVAGYRLLAFYP